MSSSNDRTPLMESAWAQLNERCQRLEKAWREADGDTVDLGQFLPSINEPLRPRYLLELIATELEIRWRRKLPITLEDYQKRFPDLGTRDSLPVTLIYEEYRVRSLYGDRPDLAIYRERFPAQFDKLQQQLNEHPLTLQYSTLKPSSSGGSLTPFGPTATPRPNTLPESAGDQIIPSQGYTLGAEIGSGQFGVVFRAQAPGGMPVAVKRIIRPISDEMCKRELRALELLSQLRHPALLSIHAYWPRQDRLVIVMELADDSLADRLKECKLANRPGIPCDELIAYFKEAAEALDYLHSQHLMHRDIKPANLLRVKGHAKVADFGLVRLQEQNLEATMPSGTPLYMAPECFRGQISIHSDQYSLAVTYAEMRLGKRIFHSNHLLELAREHEECTPHLEGLEAAERNVLLRALAKKPDKRYPSCRDFVHALSEAVQPPPPPPTVRRSSPLWALSVAALALLALLGFLLYSKLNSINPPTPPATILPSGFEQGCSETIRVYDREHFKSILYPMPEDVPPLVFLLIPHDSERSLPAFYILRDKVSRAQFAAMLPRMEQLLQEHTVEKPGKGEAWRTVRREWQQQWLKSGVADHPKYPATYITPTEAHCFAKSVHADGRLPSLREWDKAGGRYNDQIGPFDEARWQASGEKHGIAIQRENRTDFSPVGEEEADISPYSGCRDMAGNGYEWTCDVTGTGKQLLLPNPGPLDEVDRRGERTTAPEPFQFKKARWMRARYGAAPEDTSFRVVLPIQP